MRIIQFVLLAAANIPCFAQSFIIDDAESAADFSFRKDNNQLTCFYKTWNSDKNSSHYRTISFDGNLDIIDTVSYRLNGVSSYLVSDENAIYSYHIFHTVIGEKQTITFLVTDKSGKGGNTYEKTAEDFKACFKKGVKKLSELRFENIKTDDHAPEVLLLRPSLVSRSGMLKAQGSWMAFNILDGKLLWQMKLPSTFVKAKVIAGKLVTLQKATSGRLSIHYYDMKTGEELTAVPLHQGDGNRTVSVFEVDSSEVVLAGGDFGKSVSNKHPRFFLTRFDLSGHLTFDRVDTTERLAGDHLQLLGGIAKSGGDLILVGESYKMDAKAMVAGAAASVALTVLFGAPTVVGSGPKLIVLGIVTARISANGEVKEFNNFPVDRRNGFSELIKDDPQIYLRYKEQLWLYDLTKLSSPPERFKTVSLDENVIIFSGSLIGMRKDDKKKEIVLEKIGGL